MVHKYVFSLFMTLVVSSVAGSAFAQEADVLDPENHKMLDTATDSPEYVTPYATFDSTAGAKYGVLGNVGRPVTGGGSIAAEKFQLTDEEASGLISGTGKEDTNAKANARNELLGCTAIDFDTSMATSLDTNEDQIKSYVNSTMGKYMLTTLLNSPQIAATFNTVEAFGSKRVQLLQDRCQALQADATVSAEGMMRWQALQSCVADNMEGQLNTGALSDGSGGSEKERAALAVAYRACLYGSQGQQGGFSGEAITYGSGESITPSPSASFEQALAENVLGNEDGQSLWTGTLFHALQNTAFCTISGGGGGEVNAESSDGGHGCSLMALIPNVRWCAGADRYNRSCTEQSKPRMSRATYNPQQVFDIAYAYAAAEINYRQQYAAQLDVSLGRGVNESYADEIAKYGENLFEPMVGLNLEDSVAVDDDFLTQEVDVFNSCMPSDGIVDPEDFNEYIDRAVQHVKANKIQVNLTDNSLVGYGDSAPKLGTIKTSLGTDIPPPFSLNIDTIIPQHAAIEAQVSAKGDGTELYYADGNGAGQVLLNATRCVMKHHMRTTLADHLKIARLPSEEEQMAVLMAIRMKVAQATTEMMYRFLKEKVMLAQIDLENAGSVAGSRATPPHILATMDTLEKLIDNQIDNLENMRKNQGELEKVISVVQASSDSSASAK